MSAIEMQFSTEEAVSLMRVLALARRKATSMDEREDLEILHGRIYDQVYLSQRQGVAVAFGDSLRARAAQIHPFLPANQIQAGREPATRQSWREWHPYIAAA